MSTDIFAQLKLVKSQLDTVQHSYRLHNQLQVDAQLGQVDQVWQSINAKVRSYTLLQNRSRWIEAVIRPQTDHNAAKT